MDMNIKDEEYKRRSSPRLPCVEESLLDKAYGIISTSNSWMVAATAQPCRHLARDHPRKDTMLQQALHRWWLRYALTHPRTPVPRCRSCTCGVLPLAVPRLPGFPTPVLPPVHLLGCFPRCFEFRAVRGGNLRDSSLKAVQTGSPANGCTLVAAAQPWRALYQVDLKTLLGHVSSIFLNVRQCLHVIPASEAWFVFQLRPCRDPRLPTSVFVACSQTSHDSAMAADILRAPDSLRGPAWDLMRILSGFCTTERH